MQIKKMICRFTTFVVVGLGVGMTSFPILAGEIKLSSGIGQKNLVELFTSQGCSSCPPAEKFLSSLKKDDRLWQDLVPVAFHVDYWDYIGWQDPYAEKIFSQRQRTYSQQGNISQVYTPGFVVNGKEWRGFFAREAIAETVKQEVGELIAIVNGENLEATFQPMDGATKKDQTLKLNIAILGFGIKNNIAHGENKGLRVSSDFVVIGFQQLTITTIDEKNYKANTLLPETKTQADQKGIAMWVSGLDNNQPIQALGGWL